MDQNSENIQQEGAKVITQKKIVRQRMPKKERGENQPKIRVSTNRNRGR